MSKSAAGDRSAADKMIAALIELMERQPFETITVTALCRAAGVQRSTFYAHYRNTAELLEDAGKHVVADFRSYWDEKSVQEMDAPYLNAQNLMTMLRYVEAHQKIVKVFLRTHSPARRQSIVDWMVEHMTYPNTKQTGDRVYAEYITRFYLASIQAVVSTWIERGCRESADLICEIIFTCISRSGLIEERLGAEPTR